MAGQGVTESALITVPGGPDDGVVVRVPDGGAFTKARIPPLSPTAQPWLASTNDTPKRVLLVLEVWALQLAPRSAVTRIVPLAPTAQPWLASTNDTPKRKEPVPEVWALQLAPPSAVTRILPPSPTAQPWLASTNDTPLKPIVPEV